MTSISPTDYIKAMMSQCSKNFITLTEDNVGSINQDYLARNAKGMVQDIQNHANNLDRPISEFAKVVHDELVSLGKNTQFRWGAENNTLLHDRALPQLKIFFKTACKNAGWIFGVAAIVFGSSTMLSTRFYSDKPSS